MDQPPTTRNTLIVKLRDPADTAAWREFVALYEPLIYDLGCRKGLQDAEIGTAAYYVTPLHLQPALRYLGYEPGSLPQTERVAQENFSVPLWAGIDAATQERVVEAVRSAATVHAAG